MLPAAAGIPAGRVRPLGALPLGSHHRHPGLLQQPRAPLQQAHQGDLAIAEAGNVRHPQATLVQPPHCPPVRTGARLQAAVAVERLHQVEPGRPAADAQGRQQQELQPAGRLAGNQALARPWRDEHGGQRFRHAVLTPGQPAQDLGQFFVGHACCTPIGDVSPFIAAGEQRSSRPDCRA